MLSPSTKLSLSILFIFTFLVFAVNAQTPTPTPDEETEKVFVEEIKLNVFATDIDGKFVSDVKKEDLVIIEDGRIHQASQHQACSRQCFNCDGHRRRNAADQRFAANC